MAKVQWLACALAVTGAALASAAPNEYTQTNLSSDLPGVAANTDPNLVNPWGLAASSKSPFWVSDNGSGLTTVINGAGKTFTAFGVDPAPGQAPPSDPTGIVANSTSSFGGARFIFDSESGTITAWSGGASAVFEASGAPGSVYKGLGMGSNASGNLLFAANFGLGRIDVYNSSFAHTTVTGGFVDPTLPAGYAPFDIQNIGGQLYVTYAATTGGKDETDGPGLGYVDVFDTNGNFIKRLASQGALNAPWGLAQAPATFGAFGGDILVGNFGNGWINAYNPASDTWAGALEDPNGNPISIDGLWGLSFGNGSQDQDPGVLYFTAGIAGPGATEDHGLFGSLTATPEPGPLPLTLLGAATVLAGSLRRYARRKPQQ